MSDPLREFQVSDSLRRLSALQRQMNQLLDDVWSARPGGDRAWSPPVDIEEADDAWTVKADLLGVKRRDVRIDAAGAELIITGEIKEHEARGELRRGTRRSGRFEYRATLSMNIDADKIEASVSDGVLEVHIPKPEVAKPRQIRIRS